MCYDVRMNTHIKTPYPYEVVNPNSVNYGSRYFTVYLNDGRPISFYADKVVVTSNGDMMALFDPKQHPTPEQESEQIMNTFGIGTPTKDDPALEPRATLVLAAGQWTSYFATSVWTSDPIAVDRIDGIKEDSE